MSDKKTPGKRERDMAWHIFVRMAAEKTTREEYREYNESVDGGMTNDDVFEAYEGMAEDAYTMALAFNKYENSIIG